MSQLRPYLPGTVFHITTRTTLRAYWFTERNQNQLEVIIADSLPRSDARLIAFTLMSNHLHLVIRQGVAPLAQLMQPMLCRIAILIQKRDSVRGHVFGRRFHSRPCITADDVRNVIAYTHRNPLDAGLCNDPAEYRWTSHSLYASGALVADSMLAGCVCALPELFAHASNSTPAQCRTAYRRFFDWTIERDRARRTQQTPPDVPLTAAGDAFWARNYTDAHVTRGEPTTRTHAPVDLSQIARQVISEVAPAMPHAVVRSKRTNRLIVTVRSEVIRRAASIGIPGVQIAEFLNMSPSRVSEIAALRFTRALTIQDLQSR